jgi:hypothetical protein
VNERRGKCHIYRAYNNAADGKLGVKARNWMVQVKW